MIEYPKMLYRHPGKPEEAHTIVQDAEGEAKAREDGFHDYNEVLEPPKEPKGPKCLEEMKAGELIAYAAAEKLDIGDMKPQAGQERILAAVKEAIAKKAPEGEA